VKTLTGWRRTGRGTGIALSLQVADTPHQSTEDLQVVTIEMSDQQLCSLVRDLRRAAGERGMDPWAHKRRSPPRVKGGAFRTGLLARLLRRKETLLLTDGRAPPPSR
jgi:hypothetical protein